MNKVKGVAYPCFAAGAGLTLPPYGVGASRDTAFTPAKQ
jgi:hypothetical protein